MKTGEEHFAEAERLIDTYRDMLREIQGFNASGALASNSAGLMLQTAVAALANAQVHATLAHAAYTKKLTDAVPNPRLA